MPETVHPHVCGEHHNYLQMLYDMGGSSPRVWGTFSYSGSRARI